MSSVDLKTCLDAIADFLADQTKEVGITCDLALNHPELVGPYSRIMAVHVCAGGGASHGQETKSDNDALFFDVSDNDGNEEAQTKSSAAHEEGAQSSKNRPVLVRTMHEALTEWCAAHKWDMQTLLAKHNMCHSPWTAEDEEEECNFVVFFALSPRPIMVDMSNAVCLPGMHGDVFSVYDTWNTLSDTVARTSAYDRRPRDVPENVTHALEACQSIIARVLDDMRVIDRSCVSYTS